MSSWQNVGARDVSGGSDIPTKSALKASMKANPSKVSFYSTDAFGENANSVWFGNNLEIGVKYSVTGPNPYTSRKWYATVEKLANGTIKVK